MDLRLCEGCGRQGHQLAFRAWRAERLFRLGWKKDAIPVGLAVDISGYRAKSGEPVGNARSLTLPNGKELFAGGSTPEVN